MTLEKTLKGALIFLCAIFVGLQIMGLETQAAGARVSLIVLLTLLYVLSVPNKNLFFLLFLFSFCLAEMVTFGSYFVDLNYNVSIDYFYYATNSLCILAYLFLVIRILNEMSLKAVLSRFWIHLTVLIILDIFCVVMLSGTTEKLFSSLEYITEFLYNAIIMILLTVAMINYISKNTQKSMLFLLGAILIFFSEILQMTYYYISNITILNVMGSLFLVSAFLFFYMHSRLSHDTYARGIKQDSRV